MKRKYNKSLTTAERHRVSDALYRLKKEGFIIPESEVSKIKDASSYKSIYEKATKLKGAVYSPVKTTGKRQQPISAKIGYELLKEHKKYEKQRKKELKKYGLKEESIPAFNPKSIEPTGVEKRAKKLTQKEVEEETIKRAKRNISRMKKYTPKKLLEERTVKIKDNLLKAFRTTIRPYSQKLYNMIRKELNKMDYKELIDFYERIGSLVVDAMFIYKKGAFRLGVGDELGPIYTFLGELGIDINQELYKGVTINDFIESIS